MNFFNCIVFDLLFSQLLMFVFILDKLLLMLTKIFFFVVLINENVLSLLASLYLRKTYVIRILIDCCTVNRVDAIKADISGKVFIGRH